MHGVHRAMSGERCVNGSSATEVSLVQPSIDPIERRWSSRRFPYGYLVTT
jgi:hypothetical protein